MPKISLKSTFYAVNEALLKTSFCFGRFLHDHSFLDIHAPKTAYTATHKVATIATKAKRAFQRSAERTLSQKTTSGDFMPKPTGNVVFSMAQEGVHLLIKAAPYIPRIANSPASLSITVVACASLLLLDDTTRNMAMDQISQVIALFQNDAAETKANNENAPTPR